MRQLWKLLVPAAVGLGVAALSHAHHLEHAQLYLLATSLLLAVGLFGSTFQIDLGAAREHRRLIFTAVTVGVVVKAALIGGVLTLAFRDPLFLLLGVAVAQIDPLAVAAVMNHPRLSAQAKTILASWSSFDDPVTVILGVYAASLVTGLATVGGLGTVSRLGTVSGAESGGLGWLWQLGANAVFAAVAYGLWRLVRRSNAAVIALVIVAVSVAVWQFTMLGLAVAGLFLRPRIGRVVDGAVQVALIGAVFLAGMLLLDGVRVLAGIALGIAAFGAQIVVGFALTRRLATPDRVRIAFAQQNGITAIILALLFETRFAGVVAVVAPAIFVVNLLHAATNAAIDRREARPPVDVPV